ncbi:MAG: sugar phosphate isomerase/epimerase [Rhodospirillales bacterium]|nr:sugar phosphate isomerase/epimerase [Rhodospirillales bacterium]
MSIISFNTAIFDGYEMDTAVAEIAACGGHFIEPAFVPGYLDSIDETTFSIKQGTDFRQLFADSGVSCHTVSAHMELTRDGAVRDFVRRIHFAAALGARMIVTTVAPNEKRTEAVSNLRILGDVAATVGLVIALENPGFQGDYLIGTGAAGRELIEEVGHPAVGLNFDTANITLHNFGKVDLLDDLRVALPACVHLHLKDVSAKPDGGRIFVPVGQGDIDNRGVMEMVAASGREIPLSVEMPLRLSWDADGNAVRGSQPVSMETIHDAFEQSSGFLRTA